MRLERVKNRTRNRLLATRAGVADRWWLRLRGLLGRPALPAGEGLLLIPCTSIHTLGMGYAIDVAFLDRSGRVVALYPELPPRRATRVHREAASALELPAGTLAQTGTVEGDTLLREAAPGPR
jgi:uncharacterized membrane protein (UPF0127 family)